MSNPTTTTNEVNPTPYWISECGRATIYIGKCEELLYRMPTNLFHAIVTDPPYGLEFMGKDWDAPWKNDGKIETCDEGTDKSHPFRDGTQRVCYGNNKKRKVDARQRRADEMNDSVKAKYLCHNVEYVYDALLYQEWFYSCAKAIFCAAKPGAHLLSFGGTRMYHRMCCAIEDSRFEIRDVIMWVYGTGFPKGCDISKAIDKIAGVERGCKSFEQSNTWRKFEERTDRQSTVPDDNPITDAAKQWNGWNTALKPAYEPIIVARKKPEGSVANNILDHGCGAINIDSCRIEKESWKAHGRYPSNLIHDDSIEVQQALPEDACRFFYSPKANNTDRAHGSEVIHPTVKPLDLMCYLVRLVCAKGGTVLDPFMGSGSTGCACLAEGMYFVGIEQSEEYAKIAVERLQEMLGIHPIVKRLENGKRTVKDEPPPPRKLRKS